RRDRWCSRTYTVFRTMLRMLRGGMTYRWCLRLPPNYFNCVRGSESRGRGRRERLRRATWLSTVTGAAALQRS
ncbi:hypothetical protein HPB47_001020, partial [Ixodes persulcatus]